MGCLYMRSQADIDWSGSWARKKAQLCRAGPSFLKDNSVFWDVTKALWLHDFFIWKE